MKLNINNVKVIPPKLGEFGFCVFGEPSDEVKSWANFHGFNVVPSGKFTNIYPTPESNLADAFDTPAPFKFMDGFSPNLNKKLHIGHWSNLVLAKAFKSLGVCEETVSILGDTLVGEVSNDEGHKMLQEHLGNFAFFPNKIYFASTVAYPGELKDGEGDYAGTKVFEIGDEKVVALKSDGKTTYFYQDVALAGILNAPTLYLTGHEQDNHFGLLKKLYPDTQHLGLGLVKVSGKKMASREGNVILIDEFVKTVQEEFDNNIKLIYNVFAGYILKSNPGTDKNINLDTINNPKNSAGLYISYTMARLKSAGLDFVIGKPDKAMEFAYLKSKVNLTPNLLFEAVVSVCEKINALYLTHTIRDNPENQKIFAELFGQVLWGADKLGLFFVEKV